MIPKRVGMDYIKVILLANIGLTFTYIVNNSNIEILTLLGTPLIRSDQYPDGRKMDDSYVKDKINFPYYVYPTHYKVQLTVDTKSSYPIISVSGQIDISITIMPNYTMKTLFLNVKNIQIDHFHTKLYNSKEIYFVDKSYIIYKNFLAIKFTSDVPHGNYTLKAVFHSTADNSFIRYELPQEYKLIGHRSNSIKDRKNDLILTNFRKTAARELFPCWDDPAYKTTFDIEVTHEDEYTVLSNTPESETPCKNYDVHNFMTCTKFITTIKMATHQLIILLKPLDLINDDSTETVHMWYNFDSKSYSISLMSRSSILSLIHSTVNNMAQFMRNHTGILVYAEKFNHVLVPNVPYSKAELGLIIYRESDVICNETEDLNVKSEIISMIELQVVRQWYGGLIAVYPWKELWLIESLAFYLTYYFPRQEDSYDFWIDNEDCEGVNYDNTVLLRTVEKYNDILRMDNGSMPPILSESVSLSGPPPAVYHKGALILRMLSGMLSKEDFQEIVVDYLMDKYCNEFSKFGAVSIYEDLWSNLETVAHNEVYLNLTLYKPNYSLIEVIKPWIKQKGFPVVNVIVDRKHNKVKFIQHSSMYESLENSNSYSYWWIPITYIMKNTLLCYAHNFIWLKPGKVLEVALDGMNLISTDSWIIVNVGQTGYYRVRYERNNWGKLGNFLKDEDYKIIPVINRAQLINDICDEMINQYIDWSYFELVTSYLIREYKYAPWVSMLKCLDRLAEFFKLPETKWFQIHIANYFNNILRNEIGYEINPTSSDDLTERMRQNLAYYACNLDNPTCIEIAVHSLDKWMNNSSRIYEAILSPQWEKWMICFGIKTEKVPFAYWAKLFAFYSAIEIKKKTILYSLPCIENPDIIIKYLHNIIEGIEITFKVNEQNYIIPNYDMTIEEADQVNLFNIIIKRHIGKNQIFSHIVDNIKTLKPKSISLTNAYDIIITNIYSEEQLDSLYESILIAKDSDGLNKRETRQHIEHQREKIKALKNNANEMFPIKW